jgi:hypothetical protein
MLDRRSAAEQPVWDVSPTVERPLAVPLDPVIGRADQHARRRQNHRNGCPSMHAWKDELHPEHR